MSEESKVQTILGKQEGIACQTCKYYIKPMCKAKNIYVARKGQCPSFKSR